MGKTLEDATEIQKLLFLCVDVIALVVVVIVRVLLLPLTKLALAADIIKFLLQLMDKSSQGLDVIITILPRTNGTSN